MDDMQKVIAQLRKCGRDETCCDKCEFNHVGGFRCITALMSKAADSLEKAVAENKRLNDENFWLTNPGRVPHLKGSC